MRHQSGCHPKPKTQDVDSGVASGTRLFAQHFGSNSAATMHDAQHRHRVAVIVVAIEHDVRHDNPNANVLAERRPGRAAVRMIR